MAQGLKQGTILHGNYRIDQMLGQGGFGITYLAMDLSLERKVAIKEFFPKDYCDREGDTTHVTLGTQNTAQFVNKLKAKFIKEAKNIAKFDNQGIIKIHAAFEENNTAYYVMDFIEGESLSSMVKREGPLSEQTALEYIQKVGKALEYVHSHRMNHLDVKPANIMIRKRDNEPILIDFGLSKQYDTEGKQTSTTPTGISHGYAPMEQYNDGGIKEFSPQTDVYSLAATLYYILSGIVPPQATRLIDEELTFPASIPPRLVAPIVKAMSSGRRQRHESIEKFLSEIAEDSTTIISSLPKQDAPVQSKAEQEPMEPIAPPIKKPVISTPKVTQSKPLSKSASTNIKKQPNGNKNWFYIAGGVAMVCIVLAFILFKNEKEPSDEIAINSQEEAVAVADNGQSPVKAVEGMYYESSLGVCSYTGEVDENGKPNGHGTAVWKAGVGKRYEGEWKHGVMDGTAKYESSGGYKFEGIFKANHYSEGKLISPDGSYYDGSFDKDGNKWTGTEYDAKGIKTDTWKNGE